jgi:hypothetical protein
MQDTNSYKTVRVSALFDGLEAKGFDCAGNYLFAEEDRGASLRESFKQLQVVSQIGRDFRPSFHRNMVTDDASDSFADSFEYCQRVCALVVLHLSSDQKIVSLAS